MLSFSKFNSFAGQLVRAAHDFSTHTFKVLLTNSAPSAANTAKSDITELGAGNGYSSGGSATTVSISESSGTATLSGTAVTFTASGGSLGPFQYAVLYNASNNKLVGWWDYGSALTLQNAGDSISFRPNDADPGTLATLSVS
jgi:hypothetical protein